METQRGHSRRGQTGTHTRKARKFKWLKPREPHEHNVPRKRGARGEGFRVTKACGRDRHAYLGGVIFLALISRLSIVSTAENGISGQGVSPWQTSA